MDGIRPGEKTDVAFGFRMYNYQGRNLGIFVSEGNLEVKDAVIMTE